MESEILFRGSPETSGLKEFLVHIYKDPEQPEMIPPFWSVQEYDLSEGKRPNLKKRFYQEYEDAEHDYFHGAPLRSWQRMNVKNGYHEVQLGVLAETERETYISLDIHIERVDKELQLVIPFWSVQTYLWNAGDRIFIEQRYHQEFKDAEYDFFHRVPLETYTIMKYCPDCDRFTDQWFYPDREPNETTYKCLGCNTSFVADGSPFYSVFSETIYEFRG